MDSSDESDHPNGSEKHPIPDPLGALKTLADDLARSSRSTNTRRAYTSAWNAFSEWSVANGFPALPAPPEMVAVYLAHLVAGGRTTGTIQGALVAISQSHLDAGYPSPRNDPRVRRVIAGVRRRLGSQQNPKAPITREQMDAMIAMLGTDLRGVRDRALLTLGFATGMRRSELVALQGSDIVWTDAGATITIRVSKWNAGRRRVKVAATGAPSCPIGSLRAWFVAAGLGSEGPLFRRVSPTGRIGGSALQDRAVARLVKRLASALGLDSGRFSGHSLRSGFATVSARDGASPAQIQRALGHSTAAMAMRYVRDSDDDGVGPFHSSDVG